MNPEGHKKYALKYNDTILFNPLNIKGAAYSNPDIILLLIGINDLIENLSDGIHPNKKGYDKMAAVWCEAIIAAMKSE